MGCGCFAESVSSGNSEKNFPTAILKIIPMAVLLFGLAGCHASTEAVEASTTRDPVVAPAGTVLRVRLDQALGSGRSRPGDRFRAVLDTPVMVGGMEILPKGTLLEGRVLAARKAGAEGKSAQLAVTLDSFERDGKWYALQTNPVIRTGKMVEGISVPADTIMGFTLTRKLTA